MPIPPIQLKMIYLSSKAEPIYKSGKITGKIISKGGKERRVQILGLENDRVSSDKLRYAIAAKSELISGSPPKLSAWEKLRRIVILEVHDESGTSTFVKVNKESLRKRFGMEKEEFNNLIDDDGIVKVDDLQTKYNDPYAWMELGKEAQTNKQFAYAIDYFLKALKCDIVDSQFKVDILARVKEIAATGTRFSYEDNEQIAALEKELLSHPKAPVKSEPAKADQDVSEHSLKYYQKQFHKALNQDDLPKAKEFLSKVLKLLPKKKAARTSIIKDVISAYIKKGRSKVKESDAAADKYYLEALNFCVEQTNSYLLAKNSEAGRRYFELGIRQIKTGISSPQRDLNNIYGMGIRNLRMAEAFGNAQATAQIKLLGKS